MSCKDSGQPSIYYMFRPHRDSSLADKPSAFFIAEISTKGGATSACVGREEDILRQNATRRRATVHTEDKRGVHNKSATLKGERKVDGVPQERHVHGTSYLTSSHPLSTQGRPRSIHSFASPPHRSPPSRAIIAGDSTASRE